VDFGCGLAGGGRGGASAPQRNPPFPDPFPEREPMRIPTTSLCLAVLTASLAAQKTPEVEPNDSAATAMAIVPGTHLAASYASTVDEDWYSFTLTAPGQVHLHTVATGTLSLGTSRDNRIAIYDAAGNTRLAWNDSAVGTMADCGVTLPAGSYTACVALKTGAAGTYDLDFYVLPVRAIDVAEGAEPNGATGLPTPFTPGQVLEGELVPGGDEDFWSFTVATRGIALAASYDDGGVPQLDNLALRFYSGGPGAWTALGTGDATNTLSHRVTNLTHPGLLTANTYAIGVRGGTAVAGTGPWDYTKLGKYGLRTALIELPDNTVIGETAEPNNTPTAFAGVLSLGDAAIGNCTGSLDQDWYMVYVPGPTTIGAMAEPNGGAGLMGSTVRLWDGTGTVSLASGSGSATSHGRLVFTIERAGIYFISIQGPTTTVTGDYLLHVGGCAPLYLSPTTRVEPASTNACIGSNGQRPLLGFMSGEVPAFDSMFVARVERTYPSSFVAGMFGVDNTVAMGSIPLPFLLGYGGLDSQSNPTPCYVRVDPAVMVIALTDASGNAEFGFTFSPSPAALGFKVYTQALCFDPVINPLGLTVSNDASFVLGDRAF
jgi:hypothetical protein